MNQQTAPLNVRGVHKFGRDVEAATTEQAIKSAGLDWSVRTSDLYTMDGQKVNHRAVIRDDKNKVLGVVGPAWQPLQNIEAFKFFDPFLEGGECSIERTWDMKGGREICILARLNRDPIEVVKDDIVNKYLLLTNSHRGGIAVRVALTPKRMSCLNMLGYIMDNARGNGNFMAVHHNGRVAENVERMKEAISIADDRFNKRAQTYRELVRAKVKNSATVEEFTKRLFRINTDNERGELRLQKMTETVTRLFENGRGQDIKGVGGTYWALYNAATEYLTHEAGKTAEQREFNLWCGSGVRKSHEAMMVALDLAVN